MVPVGASGCSSVCETSSSLFDSATGSERIGVSDSVDGAFKCVDGVSTVRPVSLSDGRAPVLGLDAVSTGPGPVEGGGEGEGNDVGDALLLWPIDDGGRPDFWGGVD